MKDNKNMGLKGIIVCVKVYLIIEILLYSQTIKTLIRKKSKFNQVLEREIFYIESITRF